MTIKTLELKQKQFLLEYLLGAKRSSKHRTREALNPKTSSPSQGWHCWIKIGCRRVPRTNSSRTYPHQTPALDCANSIKLRLNMSGWILASHKVKFWKNYVGCHAAARNPPSCLKPLRPWTWRFSLQWLFTRRVAHKQNLLHKTVRSCSIARVLGLNMDIRWKHLNFKTDTRTHASHANTNICKSIMYTYPYLHAVKHSCVYLFRLQNCWAKHAEDDFNCTMYALSRTNFCTFSRNMPLSSMIFIKLVPFVQSILELVWFEHL